MDPIQELIGEAKADSSGRFTVDLLRAQQKMAEVAKLEPGLLIGKVLQAAVVGGASQVRLQIHPKEVVARISFPDLSPAEKTAQDELEHAVALTLALDPVEASWESAGSAIDLRQGPKDLPVQGLCIFRYRPKVAGFWEELKSILRHRTSFHAFVHQRFAFCPVPIYLDAARIAGPQPLKYAGWRGPRIDVIHPCPRTNPAEDRWILPIGAYDFFGQVHLGGKIYGTGKSPIVRIQNVEPPRIEPSGIFLPTAAPGTLLLDPPAGQKGENYKLAVWLDAGQYLSPETRPGPDQFHFLARRWLTRNAELPGAEFWPIRRGMLLNKITLPWAPIGTRIVATVSHLKVDLDQLNLVQDEGFDAMVEEFKATLAG